MHLLRARLALLALLSLLVAGAGLSAAGQSATPPCTGLCLQQVSCPAGTTTTVTGTVYAPNGTDPIPNVTVYIPNDTVAPLAAGVSCPVPGQLPSGSPLVGGFSAPDGTFTLTNVPVGTNIPLVIVAGKWRRQVVIPATAACSNTTMNVRFPRNQSEGDIPKFAVATGSQDQVECVLLKVGLDRAEFTNPAGNGRVQLYSGTRSAGAEIDATTPSADAVMGDLPTLQGYDVLMLPCEGGARTEPAAELANLVSYANAGGRVYASHYAYEWFATNPPFNTVANWTGRSIQGPDTAAATVNQGFASGATLAQWLQLVQASTTLGQIDVNTTRYDINGVNPPTQVWLNLNVTGNPVMQFTFDTPVGQTSGQCGRVLFNEYHVEGGVNSRGQIFPAECSSAATTPQEKLLEYSLFDLSNNGRPATMTPANAGFGDQVVGYASAAQTFTVTNNSVFAAALSSLSASDDFSATPSAACSSVAAGASCAIAVAFKPTTLGQHTGLLNLTFGGTALSAPLTGNGIPALRFQNASMDFGGTDVGTMTTRTELLTNLAPGPVAVPAFQVSGDYVAANNCPATLATGTSCSLTLTFTPSVYGPRPGTLSSSSAGTANLSATLTGNGYDFSTAVSPASGTVIAGLTTMPLAVTTPLGGFSAPVRFTCSLNAPGAACTLASQSLTLASAASFNLTVTTTSEFTLVGYGLGGSTLLALLAALSSGALVSRCRSTTRAATLLSVICLAALVGGITGCSGKQPATNPVSTPAGVYPVTLTVTDGILTRSATYQLTVKAN